jgi:hypothetical protein
MTQMPLNDRDFAEIRANVMREIERRRTRRVWLTAASVAFAVLAIVFVLIQRPPQNHGATTPMSTVKKTPSPVLIGPEKHSSGAAAPLRVATNNPSPVTHVSPLTHMSTIPHAAVASAVASTVTSTREPPKKHHRPEPKAPIAIASSEPMTIELQTANPDIRIIWIAK